MYVEEECYEGLTPLREIRCLSLGGFTLWLQKNRKKMNTQNVRCIYSSDTGSAPFTGPLVKQTPLLALQQTTLSFSSED